MAWGDDPRGGGVVFYHIYSPDLEEGDLGGERVAVEDDRQAVLPVPAVKLHTTAPSTHTIHSQLISARYNFCRDIKIAYNLI